MDLDMQAYKTAKLATLGGATLASIALLGFAPAAADVLVTNDGRILQVDRAREIEDGYRLEFQSGVTDPRAYWARGRLRSMGRDRSGALEDYRRAIEMAPLNASFRYDLARFLSGRAILSFGGADIRIAGFNRGNREFQGSEEELAEARANYGLATELDPENDGYRRAYEDFLDSLESEDE